MATAFTLAKHGFTTTVFEASKTLGGRARRITLPHSTQTVDNGEHLLLGAYHTTLELINAVHRTPPYLRLPLQLHSEHGLQLQAPNLPAPWHSLIALCTARGLSLTQRLQSITWMAQQQWQGFRLPNDLPVAELLRTQSPLTIQRLWEPLCLAALNTPIHQASGQIFLRVLRDSLLGDSHNSDLILPTTDLSALFPEAAAQFIQAHGGEILTEHRVQHLQPEASGYRIADRWFRAVVCAVAPQHLSKLTGAHPALAMLTQKATQLHYQAIITVYVQYAPSIRLPRPMTGLQHTLSQWVFDRGHTHQQHGLFAVIISAPQNLMSDLTTHVITELHEHLSLPPSAIWSHVINEKRATFSCDAQLQRPDQQTPWANFYLAGDYTASPYPATLEAATQSGVQCAHLLMNSSQTDKDTV